MDYLDTNLHQSILSSLASNLASSSSHDDLGLLTSAFSSLSPVPASLINGVLDRISLTNGDVDNQAEEEEIITQAAAESIIAFAQYAEELVKPVKENLDKLVLLLGLVPGWIIEANLGTLSGQEYSLSDQVSYALVHSILEQLGSADGFGSTARTKALEAVHTLQSRLISLMETAPGHRIISHLLPALSGSRRALSSPRSSFTYSFADPCPPSSFPPLSQKLKTNVVSAIRSESYDHSTLEGRTVLGTLELYSSSSASFGGLSEGLVTTTVLEHAVRYLQEAGGGKEGTLQEREMVAKLLGSGKGKGKGPVGLAVFRDTLKDLSAANDGDSQDDQGYAGEVLRLGLTLATLSSLVEGSYDQELVAVLDNVLAQNSILADEAVQTRALECYLLLVYGFSALLPAASRSILSFLLSPNGGVELDGDNDSSSSFSHSSSSTTLTACRCYSKLILLANIQDGKTSAVQALLNHYSVSTGRDGYNVGVIHATSRVALELEDPEAQQLAASMLLQRLNSGTTPSIEAALMLELAELSEVLEPSMFSEVAKGLGAASRASNNPSILSALMRLATAAASRKELHKPFLTGFLTFFADRGVSEPKGVSIAERAQALLDLIPVLDTFLSQAALSPARPADNTEVSLFRSFWYLIVLSGFLSASGSRINEWQKLALARIAVQTPGLLLGVKGDFVETGLEFDPVFKRGSHVLSGEQVRTELSHSLPTQSSAIRSLTVPQAVFLLSVLRLETLKSSHFHPSSMVTYFEVAPSPTSPTLSLLPPIASAVTTSFIHSFSDKVVTHSCDADVYTEVRRMLLLCAHQYERVRKAAIRALGEMVGAFPSLVCEKGVVAVMLELLTTLRRSCAAEYIDEYTPTYSFPSLRGGFTLTLPDDYIARNDVLVDLYQHVKVWLKKAVTRAPLEMRGLLQGYIDDTPDGKSAGYAADEEEMGKSVAIDFVRMLPVSDKAGSLPQWGAWKSDCSSQFSRSFSARKYYSGGASHPNGFHDSVAEECKALLQDEDGKQHLKLPELRDLLFRAAAYLIKTQTADIETVHALVALPFRTFSDATIAMGEEVWTWVVDERPDFEVALMVEIVEHWLSTIRRKQGLFSDKLNREDPLDQETQFTPTDKAGMSQEYHAATRLLQPHTMLLSFVSSRFQAFRYRSADLVLASILLVFRSVQACRAWSSHQLARELRMRLVSFGFCTLQGSRLETAVESVIRSALYDAALSWFALRPGWTYGSNRFQMKADLQAVEELYDVISGDTPCYGMLISSLDGDRKNVLLPGRTPVSSAKAQHSHRHHLLLALLENEIDRLRLWLNPLMDPARGSLPVARHNTSENTLRQLVRMAWVCDPVVAVHLAERFKSSVVQTELTRLVRADPTLVQDCADALQYFIGESVASDVRKKLQYLLYWAPVPVVTALRFLFPKFGGDPLLLQYAVRVLEHHPVEVTFFYIPQVVQALRSDALGYAERFIFETSKISQLFCHQIIWNMKANAYRGDAGDIPDPMKPTLDRMVDMIVQSLTGDAQEFFRREFSFFDEVTSISAKLKPFIKASKLEKKAKIDEEMAKIKVDPGVYLPSNPDGVVVDIDRRSGRPLQSHAKAPFMATFKVHREKKVSTAVDQQAQNELIAAEEESSGAATTSGFDTWQSAIFKVGDDCRQDVLALQIIAMHKNIFTCLGLDLLVTPYRVTATGPGCGVIDVVPNATSRDEMGRAKVNDLKSFFVIKYGSPDSVHFQKARINFIQSMAAYSLLCYIVQIKDRHNGNIMVDGNGCITHIGGVKFEPNSFKLSHEMVVLMGGRGSPGFRMFSELTVKAFLACRPYGQAVVDTSTLMMGAEFPSYKGEPTMHRLKERFRLDLSERDAAEYMKGVIANACENPASLVYDEFQRLTNGIPYAR